MNMKAMYLVGVLVPVVTLGQAVSAPAADSANPRRRDLFDFDWRFQTGDTSEASRPDFDDAVWQPVDLPHDFQIGGPFDPKTPDGLGAGFLPHGIGWYRKHFTIPVSYGNKIVSLDFEGIYGISDVWINGEHLGRNLNGYLGFQYDLTPHVKPGRPNVVAVRCDNSAKDTSRWYTGSGMYRHVWLLATERLHVERFGTYVTTPRIGEESAAVRVETEVRSHEAEQRMCELRTEIVDPAGHTVAHARAVAPVLPGHTFRFAQEVVLARPHRWSPEQPSLYRVISRVQSGGELKDVFETPFGIREIVIDPEHGLTLNGRKVFAKGVNIHHDNGCLGAAAFDRAIERRLEILRETGCNAIRLSHNPHAPALLDLCDRMGFLVMNEAYDKWTGQFNGWTAPFEQTWKGDLREFLRRDRNHPCVFLWSVGNECVEHQLLSKDGGVGQLRELVDFVHVQEPTRKVSCALFPARDDNVVFWEDTKKKGEDKVPTPMTFHMDVTSCNYMQTLFGHDRAKYPQLVFIASEVATHGAGRDFFDVDQAYTVGMFYWGGIDYLGEAFGWPNKGWFRGFVDTCGFRRPVSYYVQSFYSDKPLVRIAVYDTTPGHDVIWGDVKLSWRPVEDHWNWDGHDKVKLATYTNCQTVELFLNGKTLGTQGLADVKEMLMEWEVPFMPGTLRAVGRINGAVVAEHELRTSGKPERITLSSDRPTLRADGQDLAHVLVEVTDREGMLVPSATDKLSFVVSGAGVNAGVDNGDLVSDEAFQANERSVCKGKALLVVRSARSAGRVIIEASAPGLAAAKIELPVR